MRSMNSASDNARIFVWTSQLSCWLLAELSTEATADEREAIWPDARTWLKAYTEGAEDLPNP